MEKLIFGNFALIKMEVQEYDEMYACAMQEVYGQELEYVAWIEQYDDNGNIVGMSEENMLIFEDGTLAYTSRGYMCKANFYTCLRVILSIEEL